MTETQFKVSPIGYVKSPYENHEGTPIQAKFCDDTNCQIVIDSKFREGLTDLEDSQYIWVIAFLDCIKDYELKVIPYRDKEEKGLFATRSPSRPNPIGISPARIKSINIKTGIIELEGIDFLNNTPVLDIKPYIKSIDSISDAKEGWFEKGKDTTIADNRFSKL